MPSVASGRSGGPGLVLLLLLLPCAAGCGSGTGYVSGKVTYKGQPVTSGAVTFYGADGSVDSGAIDPQGNYTIARAPVGPVTATVDPGRVTATPPPAPSPGKARGPGGPAHPDAAESAPKAAKTVDIPRKYLLQEASGLKYTVVSGSQTINITLD